MYSMLNGEIVQNTALSVPLSSITVAYGTMIFDAFRSYTDGRRHRFFRVKDHVTRFLEGIEYFGTELPFKIEDLPQILAKLLDVNQLNEAAYYKLCAFWNDAPKGTSVLDLKNYKASYVLTPSRRNIPFPTLPLKVRTIEMDRNPFPLPANLKTAANYYHFRPALSKVISEGYDNLIFMSSHGYISEAVDSSVVLVKNGTVITPPLTERILPSITRDTVLKLCRTIGIATHERRVTKEDLETAEAILLCNSAFVIRQVASVNDITLGRSDSNLVAELINEFNKATQPGNSMFESSSIDI